MIITTPSEVSVHSGNASITGIRERAAAYRDQRKEEANAIDAGVNALILQGASGAQVPKSPAYLQLATRAPEEARKIGTFLENRDYMRVARAAASADCTATRRPQSLENSIARSGCWTPNSDS